MNEVVICEEDIKNFFFQKLINAGLCPEGGDLEIISEIVLDYLVDIGVISVEDYKE